MDPDMHKVGSFTKILLTISPKQRKQCVVLPLSDIQANQSNTTDILARHLAMIYSTQTNDQLQHTWLLKLTALVREQVKTCCSVKGGERQ